MNPSLLLQPGQPDFIWLEAELSRVTTAAACDAGTPQLLITRQTVVQFTELMRKLKAPTSAVNDFIFMSPLEQTATFVYAGYHLLSTVVLLEVLNLCVSDGAAGPEATLPLIDVALCNYPDTPAKAVVKVHLTQHVNNAGKDFSLNHPTKSDANPSSQPSIPSRN